MKKFFVSIVMLAIVTTGGYYGYRYFQTEFAGFKTKNDTPIVEPTQPRQQLGAELSDEEKQLISLLNQYPDKKNDINFLVMLAERFLERRQNQKALRYLKEAQQLNDNDPKTLALLAKTALLQRDVAQAKNYLDEISDNTDNTSVLFMRAIVSIIENDRNSSGNYLHRIVELESRDQIASYAQKLIDAYREFDFYKDGQPIHLQTLLARTFNQINEPEFAIWILTNVLKEKTDYRDAWILLGYAYFNLQQFGLAEDAFRKGYELDTEKPETQYFLGLTYFALQDYEQSEKFLEYAVINGFEPKVQVYQKLSEAYLKNDKYDKAVSTYENFLSLLNTHTPDDFYQPIWLYIVKLRRPERALVLAKQVMETYPGSPVALNLAGWSYLANNDLENAFKYLEQARFIDPSLAGPYLHLGELYEAKGDKNKALEQYKLAYENGQGSPDGNTAAEKYNVLIGANNLKK